MMKLLIPILLFISSISFAQEVKVLSWNLFLLPPPINFTEQGDRTNELAQKLPALDHDIMFFQEAFYGSKRKKIVNALKKSHPNVIIPKRSKKLKHILNSGLFIASKHPVEYLDQEIFSDCKSSDCLASKRAILVEMTLPSGKKVQFLNTHLQASYGGENEKFSGIRAKQLEQIKKLMERNKKEGVPQILIGDLNIDGFKDKETEFKSAKEIVAMDSVDLTPGHGRSTSVMNHCFKKDQNKEPKWIDHIWYKTNGANFTASPLEIVPVRGVLNDCECALSDHEPIEVKFKLDFSK